MKDAEVIAFATPIYFYEMCGQMKTLLDRSNPLFPSDYAFRDIYLLATAADSAESSMDGAVKGLEGWIACFEKAALRGVVRGMITKPDKNKIRQKRHRRVRGKLSGTADRPRLNVFRSNTGIYAQVIDDVAGVTLASASTLDKEVSKGTKTEQAVVVGKLVAERAVAKGISEVVFDRGGYLYHGRVKALADVARENGLKF